MTSNSRSDPVLELLEENEDLFRRVATNDDIPPWVREKYGQTFLDALEDRRTEGGGSASSTDGT